MGRADMDTLSQVLEHLTTAHYKVQAAVPQMVKCGSFGMLEAEVVAVRDRLCDWTEIAAALMDAKVPREE
ncbi:MAG: hypothetical protein K6T78_00880 [Alicyclobacillus sp.]|nr:hypothetical protein [Alicyclobacillus sp.]